MRPRHSYALEVGKFRLWVKQQMQQHQKKRKKNFMSFQIGQLPLRKKKGFLGGGGVISQPMSIPSSPSANTPLLPFFHGRKLLSPESQGQEIYIVLYPISEISTLILCLDGGRGRESRRVVEGRWPEGGWNFQQPPTNQT